MVLCVVLCAVVTIVSSLLALHRACMVAHPARLLLLRRMVTVWLLGREVQLNYLYSWVLTGFLLVFADIQLNSSLCTFCLALSLRVPDVWDLQAHEDALEQKGFQLLRLQQTCALELSALGLELEGASSATRGKFRVQFRHLLFGA